jgi:hypothetical protein
MFVIGMNMLTAFIIDQASLIDRVASVENTELFYQIRRLEANIIELGSHNVGVQISRY